MPTMYYDRMFYIAISIMLVIALMGLGIIMYIHKDEKNINESPSIITINGCKYIKMTPCEW